MSKRFPAAISLRVISLSAWLGLRFPDGWLWARMIPVAKRLTDSLKTILGSTMVEATPPLKIELLTLSHCYG